MLLYVQGWARDAIPRKEIYLDFGREYQGKDTFLLDDDVNPQSWVPILYSHVVSCLKRVT